MTDRYPARTHAKLIDNSCCRGINHRAIRVTVRHRSGRRTVSRASDNFPGQSGLLCTCTIRLESPCNCNFRLVINSEYSAQYPENWGPAPKQPIGWVVSPGADRARNPRGADTRADNNARDIPSQSVGFPRYLNSFNPHKQESDIGMRAQLVGPEQQNGGQPGEIGMPRTTQSRRRRRQVLHPTHSIGQLAIRGTWSGGQNLPDWYTVGIKSSCDIAPPSVDSTTATQPRHNREVDR